MRLACVIPTTCFFVISAAATLTAQQNLASGEPGVYQVRPNFYILTGVGGNVGVQIGIDGVLLVDSGAASASARVLDAIRKLTPKPIRYIINTSADPDHVGGNEALAKAGVGFAEGNDPTRGGAVTVEAAIEVLDRMSAPAGKGPSWPTGAWPTDTIMTPEKSMFLNDDGITSMREPAAHTDGDLIVFFRRADVIMTGDIVDTNRFPLIDVEKGGSIQGEVAALNHLIRLAIPPTPLVWKMGGTLVVPGHGYVCDQADLVEYRDMLVIIRDIIQDLIGQGKTLAQVKEANPTAGYRSRYGSDSGPWTTDMFVEATYRSLTAAKKQGEK